MDLETFQPMVATYSVLPLSASQTQQKNVPSIPLTFLNFKGSSDIFHFLPPEEYGLLSNNSTLVAHPSNFQ